MSDSAPEKIESPLASIILIMLIVLPCLLQVILMQFFDGPGLGDIWMPIYYGLTLVCSAASALGFACLFRLRGVARLVGVVVSALGLFALSRFVTFWVTALLFMPRH